MFRALLKTRMAALLGSLLRSNKGGKQRSTLGKVGMAVLMVYLVGVFFAMFGIMWGTVCVPFYEMGLDWLYFALVGVVAVVLCFIGSVFMAQNQLYNARDNDMLLSMPVPPSAILGSRMAMLLLLNYAYEALVVLPAIVIWIAAPLPVTPMGAVAAALAFLALPFISLTLSCLLGWVLAAITSRMRNKNLVTMILSLVFLGAYFYVYSNFQLYLNRLLQISGELATSMQRAVPPLYWLGTAAADGNMVSLLLFLLCCAVPFALLYVGLSRSFIGIATQKRSAAKIQYKGGEMRVNSPFMALLNREIKHFTGNAMYMLNAGLGLLFMVAAAVLLMINKEIVFGVFGGGAETELPALVCFALCYMASLVLISAPSISLEGKNLWLSQVLPVSGYSVLKAKAMTHILISLPFNIVAGAIAVVALNMDAVMSLLTILLPCVVTAFCGYLGVAVNLRFPRFDWINEVATVKQSMSVLIAMFGSMVVLAAPLVLYLLVFNGMVAIPLYLLIWGAVFGGCVLAMDCYFKKGGAKRFARLG